ncbi:hypothetical protein GGS26DRAFT_514400 [Hypomontagnella submonticulosa]|nr:hypothetical protein GGS26DRAFT_514400 [Hypomontagnella submonticulosa]
MRHLPFISFHEHKPQDSWCGSGLCHLSFRPVSTVADRQFKFEKINIFHCLLFLVATFGEELHDFELYRPAVPIAVLGQFYLNIPYYSRLVSVSTRPPPASYPRVSCLLVFFSRAILSYAAEWACRRPPKPAPASGVLVPGCVCVCCVFGAAEVG